jgi:predicted acyltransferase
LVSLDAFRGATIAAMILVNNPGNGQTTFAPLLHAKWNGWTFTDLVFPFFLWMVGLAMTFSYARRVEEGADKGKLLLHTLRRAALIFLLGLALNGFPNYHLASLRIPGVLQRIAICYLIGSIIFLYTKWRGQLAAIAGLCTVYWMLMTLVPVPGYGPGVLDPVGNFGQWVDQVLLSGHMYSQTKVWDPEGLVSTLPAIANVLFGALFGTLLRKPDLTPAEKTSWILFLGACLAFLGSFLNLFMPINKQLWTPSFAVFTSGMAALTFGCFYWVIDVLGYQRWCRWLVIYGMNAIALYALSGLFARLLSMSGWRAPVYSVFTAAAPPYIASLLFALMNVGVLYLVAWTMHRRRWYLRF